MHPLGGGGYQPLTAGYSGMEGAQSPGAHSAAPPGADPSTGSPSGQAGDHNGGGDGQNGGGHVPTQPQYTDINQILDQILNITDQSLDEAQVKELLETGMISIECMKKCFS